MCNKKCFTKKEAQSALNHNSRPARDGNSQRGKRRHKYRREKRKYYCEECNAWHLTKLDNDD